MPIPNAWPGSWPAVVPMVLALAACTVPAGKIDSAFGPYMDGAEVIAPGRSIVVIPASYEAPLAVRREVDDTVLIERVVLANDTAIRGENAIRVQTRHRGTPYARVFSGPLRTPFTEAALAERIGSEFEGFASVSAPLDRSNRRGPYRYVVADDGQGVTCVLAWQMVERMAEIGARANTYAVDLRVCSDETREAETLVRLFDEIDIAPYL